MEHQTFEPSDHFIKEPLKVNFLTFVSTLSYTIRSCLSLHTPHAERFVSLYVYLVTIYVLVYEV